MRAIIRFLICGLISGSIAFAITPVTSALGQNEKVSCCAKMQTKAGMDGCNKHAPKSDQEKECCAGCVFCLAVLTAPARPFVYPPTGEESFAAFTAGQLVRPQRPPVPPPRFGVA